MDHTVERYHDGDAGTETMTFDWFTFENCSSTILGMNCIFIQSQHRDKSSKRPSIVSCCSEDVTAGFDDIDIDVTDVWRKCAGVEIARSHVAIFVCALMLLASIAVIILVSTKKIQPND